MMRCRFSVLLILCVLRCGDGVSQEAPLRVAFWNVENFFDSRNDSLTNDDEFTPQGLRHWTRRRFEVKRDAICKGVAALDYPVVMGLAEVENDYVLQELLMGTPLRKFDYGFVHYDSPDARGIDCALLYRKSHFIPYSTKSVCLSDSTLLTRDILLVEGCTPKGDTLLLLVNHWPSKRGGVEAEQNRMRIAHKLRVMMDSLHRRHPAAVVLAMGDFNSSPEEDPVALGMGFHCSDTNAEGLRNLMASFPLSEGSYYYQGQWSMIDQMFVTGPRERIASLQAQLLRVSFLLVPDTGHLCERPFRTYQGYRYQGGFSDHLPVFVDIR